MNTDSESKGASGDGSEFERQLLSALELAQRATTTFVSAWFTGAAETTKAMVDLVGGDGLNVPAASELLNYSRELVNAQQEFFIHAATQADPISLLASLRTVQVSLSTKPEAVAAASTRLSLGLEAAVRATLERAAGKTDVPPVAHFEDDKRFADPAYSDNPLFFLMGQQYLLGCQYVNELLDAAALEGIEDQKARFATKFILDALCPTNTFIGNPQAQREALSTQGESVSRGARNMLDDISRNGGWPSQVDTSGHNVGENIAITPGAVVFRNELIELIQYSAQTEQVYSVPMLFSPPWINKYYIMDLAPGRSLIEWAVQHGHVCFAISYRNPDSSMRDFGMDDYLSRGLFEAVRVIREITGAEHVNLVSLCLGGTLSALALAYDAHIGDDSINCATFLNTHTSFSEPGVLGIFTDEATIEGLEKQMEKKGYLEADAMAHVFDLLRANDLVFQYVANNWLLGKQPAAFDLLVWNNDSTRLPARMQSEYLRKCYLHNEFARGVFEALGVVLDPKKVTVDTYVVSAINDHIVPWVSGYETARIFSGPSRFVLSTAGHIAGIVNPPNPKANYWTNDERPASAEDWKAGAKLVQSTWWLDWERWVGYRAGTMQPAPKKLGSKKFKELNAAPGTYVLDRA